MSSGEANRSDNGTQGPPQDRNQSKMDTIEDLRKKLQKLEKRNLELASQHNQDMSHYEKEIMKLRLELERGEALRRVLESEMSFARKDAQVQMYSAEDELCDAKAKLLEMQARRSEPRHQRFTYRSEGQFGQSYSPYFPQMVAEDDVSIEELYHGTYSGSGTDLPSEPFWLPFVPEENITPRGPAPDESFWGRIGYQLAKTPPAHARDNGGIEYFQPQFVPRGAAAPCPEIDDIFRVTFVPRAARTHHVPVPPPDDIFQPRVSPSSASAPAAPTRGSEGIFQSRISPPAASEPAAPTRASEGTDIFRVSVVPQADRTPPAPVPDSNDTVQRPVSPPSTSAPAAPTRASEGTDIFRVSVVSQADRTPPAPVPDSNDTVQRPVSPPSTSAPAAPTRASEDIFRVTVVSQAARTPPAPVPDSNDTFQPRVSLSSASAPAAPTRASEVCRGDPGHRTYTLSATDATSDGTLYITCPEPGNDATNEPFQLQFTPQEISTSRGPAPDVCSGQPGHRTYILSGRDITSGGTPYRTYTLPRTDTTSEYLRRYFVPQGISTSRGPAPDVHWHHPEHRTYILSGRDISSGRTPYRTYTLPRIDITSESLPQGISTSRGPAPDVCSGQPGHRTYILSGRDITSGGTPYRTYTLPRTDTTSEYFPLRFVPQGISTSRGPAPDVHRHHPGQRTYILSGRDISSGGTPYRTYTLPRTDTTSESLPQGISTSRGPAPDVCSGQPGHRTYILSGRDITSGGTPYRTYTLPRTDTTSEYLRRYFVPQGISTSRGPAPDASWSEFSPEDFTDRSESELDQSYGQHIQLLRSTTSLSADPTHYRVSGSDSYDSSWVYCQPTEINIPIPSGRSGRTYSLPRQTLTTYVQVMPSRIETLSWLDDSSRIRPLSTFTTSTPSWERIRAPGGAPVHPPAPANASFGVKRRRAHSLPPFRSVSQDMSSNTGRIQEI